MKTRLAVSIAFGALTALCPALIPGAEPASRPNIVLILADDLGYGDLHCYGRSDIRTPVLDRLAAEGVRFTQCYANGPECTPTRAALMTGRYPQRVGGLECAIGNGNVGRYDDAVRLRETHDLGLPASETSIASLLRHAGYATALFGKWHLGYEPKFSPNQHGFQEAFYAIGGGMDYFHHQEPEGLHALYHNGQPIKRAGYFTDLITDQAIEYVERPGAAPFFLYLAFTAPHSPFQGPDDVNESPLPADSPLWNQGQAPPAVYIAMIERMDRSIGRLLRALEQRGLAENTLVIFLSDNGGTASGRNAPLSGNKGTTFEGGIRVPGIVRWPGKIAPGTVSDQVACSLDFTVSMLNAAGATVPDGRRLDGIDVLQLVRAGGQPVPRTLFWRKKRGEQVWWAVRDGDRKFVRRSDAGRLTEYLFDLSQDVAEKQNLLDDQPADRAGLARMLSLWEQDVLAPRP